MLCFVPGRLVSASEIRDTCRKKANETITTISSSHNEFNLNGKYTGILSFMMRLSLPNTHCHPHTHAPECLTLCPDKIQQIAGVYVDKIETYLSACLLSSSSHIFHFYFLFHRRAAGRDIFYSSWKWKFKGHREFAILSIFSDASQQQWRASFAVEETVVAFGICERVAEWEEVDEHDISFPFRPFDNSDHRSSSMTNTATRICQVR